MGFFSRLFGGSEKTAEVKTIEPVEYKGFLIYRPTMEKSKRIVSFALICSPLREMQTS